MMTTGKSFFLCANIPADYRRNRIETMTQNRHLKRQPIILVNPPVKISDIYGNQSIAGSIWVPLGLCYLAAVGEKAGYEIKI